MCYREAGLDIALAINARETGIYSVWQAMLGGKLKVFKSCAAFWGEFRKYRRDEKGQIVKEHDHLMDATRYLWMSGRDRMTIEVKAPPTRYLESFRSGDGWMA